MFLNSIGNCGIERLILEREMGCIPFNKTYILNILLRKRYKIAVSVNCCDLRPGIPPVQCFSKSARTSSYFQYLHFFIMVQAEQVIILCKENIIKPQLSAEV